MFNAVVSTKGCVMDEVAVGLVGVPWGDAGRCGFDEFAWSVMDLVGVGRGVVVRVAEF